MSVVVVVYHVQVLVEDWVRDVQGTEDYFVELRACQYHTHVALLALAEQLTFL